MTDAAPSAPSPAAPSAPSRAAPTPRFLTGLVASQRREAAAAAIMLTIHEAGEAAVPVLIGVIIDRAITGSDGAALVRWLLVLLFTFVVLSLSYRFGARTSRRATLSATHLLRERVAAKVLGPRGDITGQLPGHVLTVATADTVRAGRAVSVVANGVSSAVTLVVVTVALLASSLVVGLVVVVTAPPVLIVMHRFSVHLERRSGEQQENAAVAAGMATDLVEGLRVLKGIGGERAALTRYRTASRASLTATLRAAQADALYGALATGLTGAFVVGVTLVAARQAVAGSISLGALIAIVGLAQLILDPLGEVAGIGASLARARASAVRVSSVLDAPPMPDGGVARLPAVVRGEIRIDRLTAGTLRDLSLTVPPGQMLGVVAAASTDATALIDCLGRRRDPTSGVIEIDGHALSTLEPDDVRTAIVVSDHDASLFEGTVAENIADGSPEGEDAAAVDAAVRAAAVDQMIDTLPAGSATHVGEDGRALSGGQRQRVAIARALATDAPVLVVHDPTTAVDSVTKARIAAAVRAMRTGRTTILVTTSPALLDACDRVVIVDGHVVADGTHGSLHERDDYRVAVML